MSAPTAQPAAANATATTHHTHATAPASPPAVVHHVPSGAHRARHHVGFWIVALNFMVMMAFATVPTPLYSLYQARDGFQTFTVTLIFAAYAVGVMLALNLAGHVSDWMGRRKIMIAAAAVQTASAVLFLAWNSVAGLITARFVSGLAIGMLTATATASLAELRTRATGRPGIATTVSTAVNLGGLALGPLVGGLFAEFSSAPLVMPYVVFGLSFVLLIVVLAAVPETVEKPAERVRYRAQRIVVPAHARRDYWLAGAAAAAAFSVTGFFGSVAPTFLIRVVGERSHLVAGLVSFAVFGAAAVAQLAFVKLSVRVQTVLGVSAMLLGMAVVALAGPAASLAMFVGGGLLGGLGMGLIFRSILAFSASLADDAHRGEVLAGTFLMSYVGMAIVPVAVGVALLFLPLVPVLVGFSALVFVLVALSAPILMRRA